MAVGVYNLSHNHSRCAPALSQACLGLLDRSCVRFGASCVLVMETYSRWTKVRGECDGHILEPLNEGLTDLMGEMHGSVGL